MTKVRVSQIPEESGKPKFQSRKMKTTVKSAKDYDDEEDDETSEDSGGEEQKRLKKTVIHFSDDGITINKGLEPGQFVRKTDVSLWYSTEELRDEKWEKLMTILESEGLSVINI